MRESEAIYKAVTELDEDRIRQLFAFYARERDGYELFERAIAYCLPDFQSSDDQTFNTPLALALSIKPDLAELLFEECVKLKQSDLAYLQQLLLELTLDCNGMPFVANILDWELREQERVSYMQWWLNRCHEAIGDNPEFYRRFFALSNDECGNLLTKAIEHGLLEVAQLIFDRCKQWIGQDQADYLDEVFMAGGIVWPTTLCMALDAGSVEVADWVVKTRIELLQHKWRRECRPTKQPNAIGRQKNAKNNKTARNSQTKLGGGGSCLANTQEGPETEDEYCRRMKIEFFWRELRIGPNRHTALGYAFSKHNEEMIAWLIKKAAELIEVTDPTELSKFYYELFDYPNFQDYTLMMCALAQSERKIMQFYFRSCINLLGQDAARVLLRKQFEHHAKTGRSILMMSWRHGGLMQFLLEEGAKLVESFDYPRASFLKAQLSLRDNAGCTLVGNVVLAGSYQLLTYLFSLCEMWLSEQELPKVMLEQCFCAVSKTKTHPARTVLDLAIEAQSLPIVKEVYSKFCEFYDKGWIGVQISSKYKKDELPTTLKELFTKFNADGNDLVTAAAAKGTEEIMQFIFERYAELMSKLAGVPCNDIFRTALLVEYCGAQSGGSLSLPVMAAMYANVATLGWLLKRFSSLLPKAESSAFLRKFLLESINNSGRNFLTLTMRSFKLDEIKINLELIVSLLGDKEEVRKFWIDWLLQRDKDGVDVLMCVLDAANPDLLRFFLDQCVCHIGRERFREQFRELFTRSAGGCNAFVIVIGKCNVDFLRCFVHCCFDIFGYDTTLFHSMLLPTSARRKGAEGGAKREAFVIAESGAIGKLLDGMESAFDEFSVSQEYRQSFFGRLLTADFYNEKPLLAYLVQPHVLVDALSVLTRALRLTNYSKTVVDCIFTNLPTLSLCGKRLNSSSILCEHRPMLRQLVEYYCRQICSDSQFSLFKRLSWVLPNTDYALVQNILKQDDITLTELIWKHLLTCDRDGWESIYQLFNNTSNTIFFQTLRLIFNSNKQAKVFCKRCYEVLEQIEFNSDDDEWMQRNFTLHQLFLKWLLLMKDAKNLLGDHVIEICKLIPDRYLLFSNLLLRQGKGSLQAQQAQLNTNGRREGAELFLAACVDLILSDIWNYRAAFANLKLTHEQQVLGWILNAKLSALICHFFNRCYSLQPEEQHEVLKLILQRDAQNRSLLDLVFKLPDDELCFRATFLTQLIAFASNDARLRELMVYDLNMQHAGMIMHAVVVRESSAMLNMLFVAIFCAKDDERCLAIHALTSDAPKWRRLLTHCANAANNFRRLFYEGMATIITQKGAEFFCKAAPTTMTQQVSMVSTRKEYVGGVPIERVYLRRALEFVTALVCAGDLESISCFLLNLGRLSLDEQSVALEVLLLRDIEGGYDLRGHKGEAVFWKLSKQQSSLFWFFYLPVIIRHFGRNYQLFARWLRDERLVDGLLMLVRAAFHFNVHKAAGVDAVIAALVMCDKLLPDKQAARLKEEVALAMHCNLRDAVRGFWQQISDDRDSLSIITGLFVHLIQEPEINLTRLDKSKMLRDLLMDVSRPTMTIGFLRCCCEDFNVLGDWLVDLLLADYGGGSSLIEALLCHPAHFGDKVEATLTAWNETASFEQLVCDKGLCPPSESFARGGDVTKLTALLYDKLTHSAKAGLCGGLRRIFMQAIHSYRFEVAAGILQWLWWVDHDNACRMLQQAGDGVAAPIGWMRIMERDGHAGYGAHFRGNGDYWLVYYTMQTCLEVRTELTMEIMQFISRQVERKFEQEASQAVNRTGSQTLRGEFSEERVDVETRERDVADTGACYDPYCGGGYFFDILPS